MENEKEQAIDDLLTGESDQGEPTEKEKLDQIDDVLASYFEPGDVDNEKNDESGQEKKATTEETETSEDEVRIILDDMANKGDSGLILTAKEVRVI